jgi:hypothetical protein
MIKSDMNMHHSLSWGGACDNAINEMVRRSITPRVG